MSNDFEVDENAGSEERPLPVVKADTSCDLITMSFTDAVEWLGLKPKQAWELSAQLSKAALRLECHVPLPKAPDISDDLVWKAMVDHGGHFVRNLGNLFSRADSINRAKIKIMWAGYWGVYMEMAIADQAKLKSIEEGTDDEEKD